MARGKQTCRILKEIRRQIAEANNIEFITSECRYKGDCLGTCPKCEAEVRYLEQQLHARSLAGKAVALAGISAGMILMSGCSGSASNQSDDTSQDQLQMELTRIVDSNGGSESDEHRVYEYDEVVIKPEFPGGWFELYKFVHRNLKYPKELDGKAVEGRVIIRFYVDTIGKIHDIKVVRGIHPALDKEALRIVSLLPDFKPGEIYDENEIICVGEYEPDKVKVNTYFTLPISFNFQ